MKIHIAEYEPEKVGGGWSFQRNFAKYYELYSYEEADTYLIAGVSMVSSEQVRQAKADGKKIVLRVDNMPRRSRNRRWIQDGKTKIKLVAEMADLVIYQSNWARDMYSGYLEKNGPVILNGVDTEVYNSKNRNAPEDSYLYARSSRDESKNWIFAWYWFLHNKGTLEIAGPFSPENIDNNFDFYNGEKYIYVGSQPSLVDSYKRNQYFLYTYLNDACSNTLLEARACGCEIINVYGMLQTGGAPEIMKLEDLSAKRMAEEYLRAITALS